MNSKEFIKEISKLNDKELINDYIEFMKYQEIAWEILEEFINICEIEKIPYQLAYGSLLGAIRDQGQIPWDYDIDVFVPYKYRNKLINFLRDNLNKKYYIDCIETNKNYDSFIVRMSQVNFSSEVLHVDIFFLIGTDSKKEKRLIHQKRIKKLYLQRYYKYFDPIFSSKGYVKRMIKYCIFKFIGQFVRSYKNIEQFKKECLKYDIYSSEYLITADRFVFDYILKKEMLETIKIKIKNKEICIPKNYDSVLKEIYGDYMKIPSLSKRINEFKNYLKIIRENINYKI